MFSLYKPYKITFDTETIPTGQHCLQNNCHRTTEVCGLQTQGEDAYYRTTEGCGLQTYGEDKCHGTTEVCGLHRERTNVTEPQRHVVYKMSRVAYGAIPEWLTFCVT